jgi:hypothetical protein
MLKKSIITQRGGSMSNHQNAIELVKALSGQSNVLTIPHVYIDYMGSIDGGLFLNQLIYWSDKGGGSDGWFYKTYLEWEEETTLSKYEISKQVGILKEKDVLITKVKKANGAPTVHYKFLFSEFQNSIVKFLNYRKSRNSTIESQETRLSLTETTTETIPDKQLSANADFSRPISLLSEKEIKALKLPLGQWKQYLEDEQAERQRKGVIKFVEIKIAIGPLLPSNEQEMEFFKILAEEYDADNKTPPKKFPSLETKRLFNEAIAFHNGTLESVIKKAIHKRGKGIQKIVDYINSPKWRDSNDRQRSTQTRQRQTTGQAPRGQGQFTPPAGSGQTPEMARRLHEAFDPKV